MSYVDRIEALSGGRHLVCLADGRRFPLYKKELDQFRIHEGETLAPECEAQIFQELLPKRAKLCAMNYLQRMDRTEQQLRRKLGELSYPEDIAEQAVDYVKSYHYIDDVRYARNYIEYRKASKSLRRLEQELYQKGISQEAMEAALNQSDTPDEERQIRGWLEKKHFSSEADRKETDRMIQFLLRRGYQLSAIRRVMSAAASELPEEQGI